jgi:trehalose/maltose hydrolase-like predicted phosphorylase
MMRRVAWNWLLLLATVPALGADDSFHLSAGWQDLASYFPPYLANGYVSTLGTPRGTEPARSYMVGFMDYSAGDVSRPAAVPGWTEIDFSADASGTGREWMNRVRFSKETFTDYRQTLDLHAATLTTRYHYRDRARDTAVEVTTFVSQAAPHLAATSIRITPDYDGLVELKFPLTLWADYVPRFALAKISDSDMHDALAAYDLNLEPRPPATVDRAALWYPGHTQVRSSDAEGATLSMWLTGQAENGLGMGMAAAIALPDGVPAQAVRVARNPYALSVQVTVRVERGRSYVFTKFVAFSRDGWGGSAAADLQLAREARDRGLQRLQNDHAAAWDALWQSDLLIEGDPQAQQAVHSELYYLLSSATADTAWGLGPCGLTPCYSGHAFWDSDSWIFPALVLLHPERAKSMVAFRERTADAARARASQHGLAGAMYPWESDPENGTEQTPHSAAALAETEIHVNADVAIAQWQYYLATHDVHWLKASGWPVLRDVARFWASRVDFDAQAQRYHLSHVNSVAESNGDIADDTFTNVAAARALSAAVAAARIIGEHPDPAWARIARLLYIPLSADGAHHLAFAPKVVSRGDDFGGGPLALLFLPSLDLPGDIGLRRSDYDYAIGAAVPTRAGAVSMGIAPRAIAAATIGHDAEAGAWFATNFTGGTLKAPFNVRTESADNNTGYFLTGSGGYLQSILYGFSGLRLRDSGLVAAYPPVLPPGWTALTLRNLSVRGQHLDVHIARDTDGVPRLTRTVH